MIARMRPFLFLAAFACLSCASSPGSAETPKANAVLACKYGEGIPDNPTPYTPGPAVKTGQPTDTFARARRLFDAEQYVDAIPVLQKVTNGDSGDDEGNVELAEYFLGASFFRIRQFGFALDAFKPIVTNPSHLKHIEAALWLEKLAEEPLTSERAVDLLYLYTDVDLARYDDANQRDTLYRIQLARARAAYRRGRYDEALGILLKVRAYEPLRQVADNCAELAAASRHSPPK
jgi:tetratricopeptide (TPR) repeat protein